LIIFSTKDNYITAKARDQSERVKSQCNSFLKGEGFWWCKEDYCWKLFSLYLNDNLINKCRFIDEVEGNMRSLLSFRRELENKEWVTKTGVKYDKDLLKYPPLNRGQIRAINNVVSHEGFILNLSVGYGKSYISASAFNHLLANKICDKIFIVTVNSMVNGWASELVKFTDLNREEIYVFDAKKARNPWENNDCKALICSYNNLKCLVEDLFKKKGYSLKAIKESKKYNYHEEFLSWSKDFFMIIDESHHISSHKSKNNKYVKGISLVAKQVVTMTGTLYRRGFEEIFQQLSVVAPDLVDNFPHKGENYQRFLNAIAELEKPYSTKVVKIKEEMKSYLEPLYSKYIQKGETVIDVETHDNKIDVKLSEKHFKFYQEVSQMILANSIEDDEGVSSSGFLSNYNLFTQALADPNILKEKYPLELKDFKWNIEENVKYQATLDILENHPFDKVIIWVKTPSLIKDLNKKLSKYGVVSYCGETKIPKGITRSKFKTDLIEKFNTTEDNKILITNEMSLGTGVTITGASVSIHWTITSNYVDYAQSKGRIRRFGQTKSVYYYYLIADNSIDKTSFRNLDDRGYLNGVKAKYKYLSQKQIKSLLLGEIIS
jgi:SNF2 family DNA or RNA helicase